jgi:hypothetical protein
MSLPYIPVRLFYLVSIVAELDPMADHVGEVFLGLV